MRTLFLFILLGVPALSYAQFGTKEEAKAMVEKAIDVMADKGEEETFELINDKNVPDFHDRDLYVFVMSMDGKATILAHGVKPQMIGKDFYNFQDRAGEFRFQEIMNKVQKEGEGWVQYNWPNPLTQRMASKTTFVKQFGDVLIGVGVYEDGGAEN